MMIGSADAIVMRMMITAKNFAINVPSSADQSEVPFVSETPSASAGGSRCIAALFAFESEVGGRGLSASHGYLSRLRSQIFLPRRDRVVSGRHVVDSVRTISVGGRIRTFDHHEPSMHPWMNVALHRNDLRGLPTLFNRRSPRRLRLVPRNVAGHRIR